MSEEQRAYEHGRADAKVGRGRLNCPYTGRLRDSYLSGHKDGRNEKALARAVRAK